MTEISSGMYSGRLNTQFPARPFTKACGRHHKPTGIRIRNVMLSPTGTLPIKFGTRWAITDPRLNMTWIVDVGLVEPLVQLHPQNKLPMKANVRTAVSAELATAITNVRRHTTSQNTQLFRGG